MYGICKMKLDKQTNYRSFVSHQIHWTSKPTIHVGKHDSPMGPMGLDKAHRFSGRDASQQATSITSHIVYATYHIKVVFIHMSISLKCFRFRQEKKGAVSMTWCRMFILWTTSWFLLKGQAAFVWSYSTKLQPDPFVGWPVGTCDVHSYIPATVMVLDDFLTKMCTFCSGRSKFTFSKSNLSRNQSWKIIIPNPTPIASGWPKGNQTIPLKKELNMVGPKNHFF